MPTVFRISTAHSCPRIDVVDRTVGHPSDWVSGKVPPWVTSGTVPWNVVSATIDRPPRPREFCRLVPGALVLPEEALDDGSGGPNDMYYALWWRTHRVDLAIDGRAYACVIPNLTLRPDPRSEAPCRLDGELAAVFRIEGRGDETFCVSGSGCVAAGDEFPHIYECDGFEGIVFEPIWSGERPTSASSSPR